MYSTDAIERANDAKVREYRAQLQAEIEAEEKARLTTWKKLAILASYTVHQFARIITGK